MDDAKIEMMLQRQAKDRERKERRMGDKMTESESSKYTRQREKSKQLFSDVHGRTDIPIGELLTPSPEFSHTCLDILDGSLGSS